MKLSTFLINNMEDVLKEWDKFARTLDPSEELSKKKIRDHAEHMLRSIALDIDTYQNPQQQIAKSQGLPTNTKAVSGASTHGTERQSDGFTLLELTAEFRALRATVQRLWFAQGNELTPEHSADLIRFNEAIDQALSESVMTYTAQAARTKDIFLAILSHDLRSPLTTIAMSGSLLNQPGISLDYVAKLAPRIIRNASVMNSMVNDLLEYARSELGSEMPMTFSHSDIVNICHAAVTDASSVHPNCSFIFDPIEPVCGSFDQVRLQQVLTNLLNNAAQYRGDDLPVTMTLLSNPDSATISIKNSGAVIPKEAMNTIFDPMVQLAISDEQSERASTSLGLGLYIAKRITESHNGTIEVASTDSTGTIFSIIIPRCQPSV